MPIGPEVGENESITGFVALLAAVDIPIATSNATNSATSASRIGGREILLNDGSYRGRVQIRHPTISRA